MKKTYLAAITLGTLSLSSKTATSIDNEISINEAICLNEKQILDETSSNDLLSFRRLGIHYMSCEENKEEEGLNFLRLAAQNGTFADIGRLAEAVDLYLGEADAAPIFLEAAQKGDVKSQIWISDFYKKSGKDKSLIEYWLSRAAHQGDTGAMQKLAESIAETNLVMSLVWLERARSRVPVRAAESLERRINEVRQLLSPRELQIKEEIEADFIK